MRHYLVIFKDCVVVLRRSPVPRLFEKYMNDYSGAYQKVEKWAVAFSLCLALSWKLFQAAVAPSTTIQKHLYKQESVAL